MQLAASAADWSILPGTQIKEHCISFIGSIADVGIQLIPAYKIEPEQNFPPWLNQDIWRLRQKSNKSLILYG